MTNSVEQARALRKCGNLALAPPPQQLAKEKKRGKMARKRGKDSK